MSYPKGDQAPQPGPGRSQRPSFDRPSLFAGMEDDDTLEDTRRVRILSTLESTRQASRPSSTRSGRRTRKSNRRGWLQGVLWGVLGVGVLALMAGFVMVIQDSKPALAHTPPPAATRQAQVKKDTGLTHLAALPAAAAGPAVIETAPVAPQALPTSVSASAALPAAPTVAADTLVASTKSSPSAPADKATPASPTPVTTAKTTNKPANHNATKGQDDDVALLEAMFAHTGRKATSKPVSPQN
ncbi:MAG: hypothetical protein EOP36_14905 [Rubrivivax sp.]|nr:MAG: hypothetical protein EOP36_14905 [Rubrivivax sp.]